MMKKLLGVALAVMLISNAQAFTVGAFGQYEYMDDEFKGEVSHLSFGAELGYNNDSAYSFLSIGTAGSGFPLYVGLEGGLSWSAGFLTPGIGVLFSSYLYDEKQTRVTVNPDNGNVTKRDFFTRSTAAIGGTLSIPLSTSLNGRVAAYYGADGPIARASIRFN